MATVLDDLWPEDIKTDDVLTPQEILEQQAQYLTKRTNSVLVGRVVRTEAEDRIILGFEVTAPRIETTMRLFSVQHRTDLEYPVAIDPPDDDLPDFLKERKYRPGIISVVEQMAGRKGKWVENEWIAATTTEFTEKVAKVLASSSVVASVLSLISRSKGATNINEPEETQDS